VAYNQTELVSIGLRKFNGLTSSTPVENECGLVVDINHIPEMSPGNVIAPIECVENTDYRSIPLLLNSTLQFKSRIINGTFSIFILYPLTALVHISSLKHICSRADIMT
jgi:hypothetical protein